MPQSRVVSIAESIECRNTENAMVEKTMNLMRVPLLPLHRYRVAARLIAGVVLSVAITIIGARNGLAANSYQNVTERLEAKSMELINVAQDFNQMRFALTDVERSAATELYHVAIEASDQVGFLTNLIFLKQTMRDKSDTMTVDDLLKIYFANYMKQSDAWVKQVNSELTFIKKPAVVARGEHLRALLREIRELLGK